MAKTLTPAQQRVISKMASGAELFCSWNYRKHEYRDYLRDSTGTWRIPKKMITALTNAGAIKTERTVTAWKYTLTPLGLSLARKDGE